MKRVFRNGQESFLSNCHMSGLPIIQISNSLCFKMKPPTDVRRALFNVSLSLCSSLWLFWPPRSWRVLLTRAGTKWRTAFLKNNSFVIDLVSLTLCSSKETEAQFRFSMRQRVWILLFRNEEAFSKEIDWWRKNELNFCLHNKLEN